jgi:CO/xanthine dehydrogenase Mo-binding subunit
VRNGLTTNAAFNPQFSISRGDAKTALAAADVVVDLTTNSAFEQHVAFEPHAAIVEWHDDDTVTVWSSTQYPHGMRDGMAQSLQMPQSRIRLLADKTGGGWGDKTGKQPYHVYAGLLAKRTRRPVRYEGSRKDIFYEQGHNFPKQAEIHVGVKQDGTITAISGESWIPVGAYNESLGNSDDWEAAARLYKCDNVDLHGNAALTNTVITSPLRCVGEPGGLMTLQIAVDMAAEKLNMDPLAFHLKNIEEQVDQTNGLPYSSCGLRDAIQQGATAFNWAGRWKGWNPNNNVQIGDDPVRGIGMMVQETAKGAAILARTAVVQIDTDGSVSIHTAAADIGAGQATAWTMIAAEALGVPTARVRIYCMDTEAGPDSSGMFGSRGTKTVGMAVKSAAEDAANQILTAAAGSLDAPAPIGRGLKVTPADLTLDLANNMVVGKTDSSIKLPLGAVIGAGGTIIGSARLSPFISGYSQKTFAASFYEVEVDPGTGFVHVTEVVQVHDLGKAINPTAAINQIEGGIMQGIDKALSVRMIYDAPTGVVVNPNLDDYKLHTIDQLPDKVQALFVEPIDVAGPYGAKGIGEPPIASALSAISNAIYNAIGVRMTDAPYTPAKILAALKAKSA